MLQYASPRRSPRFRPHLEPLESRTVPALFHFSTDVPVAIVDEGTVTSELVVPAQARIVDLDVRLDLTHTYDSDLTAVLVAPDGTQVGLFTGVGRNGDDFSGTILDDEAANAIGEGDAPFVGRFRPAQALSAFDGLDFAGTWRLRISDGAAGDVGTLEGWSLTARADVEYVSSDVPVEIPDLSTVRSSIVVPDDFTIDDLDVRLDVSHSYDSDLDVILVSPEGTRILLFRDVGDDGQDFSGTTLDDEAGVGIWDGDAPFSGRFRPEESLAVLDGTSARGTWHLEITDVFEPDPGTLTGWSLVFASPLEIRGTVFDDLDGDGFRGESEPGSPDVLVFLDQNGNGLADAGEPAARTDNDGAYSFGDLAPGTYLVTQQPPPESLQTHPALTPPRELFRADFEGGDDGFTSSGENDQWHRSDGRGNDGGRSPTHGFYFGSGEIASGGGGYVPNADGTLLSPVIDLTDVEGPLQLEFRHFLRSESGYDFASVGLLVDGIDTLLGVGSGATDAYNAIRLDLSPFAGKQVRVFFRFTSDGSRQAEGWYVDDVVVRVPGQTGQLVQLQAGQRADGIDFGNRPLPDLVGASFEVVEPSGVWGESVTVRYTLENRRPADAGPFGLDFRLSPDVRINGQDLLVGQVRVDGLAAGARATGSLELRLPGGLAAPPEGFAGLLEAYLGLLIDPDGEVLESDEANNSGSRSLADVDRFVPITPFVELEPNDTLPSAEAVTVPLQLDGQITSFSDRDNTRFEVGTPGLLRVRLSPSTQSSSLRLELRTQAGVVLVRSDAGADPGSAASIEQHLLPGTYLLTVSAISGGGAGIPYRVEAAFTATSDPFEPTAGRVPYGLTIADVNLDGRLDLAVANFGSGDVSVLLGNGDGSFEEQRRFAVGDSPVSVAAADVNGDGLPDLLVANYGTRNVSVLLGNGDGTFEQQRRFAVGRLPLSVAATDVNGDGLPDLLVANHDSDDVSVLLGKGHGDFQEQRRFPAGDGPWSVTAADVNGDEVPDLLVANYNSDDVSVLLGKGHGDFQEQYRLVTGAGSRSVAAADVNGDEVPDLLVSNFDANTVSVLLGKGQGEFQEQRLFGAGDGPTSLAVADVDGDGHLDLFLANFGSNDVSVLPGDGQGSFGQTRRLAAGDGPASVAVADADGDKRLDLILANSRSNDVSVLLGNGDGSFREKRRFAAGDQSGFAATADVDGDGLNDLLVANSDSDDVSVLLGNGDGSFQEQRRFATGDSPFGLTVVDVNLDGRLDLAVADYGAGVSVLLGNGDGSFQQRLSVPAGAGPSAVAAADINGDGLPDLLVAKYDSDDVSVLLGKGDGSFQEPRSLTVGDRPSGIAVADVDGDGLPDLLVANYNSDDVSVLLGKGDGSFQTQRRVVAGEAPASVAAEDVDADGRLDLLVANAESDDVSVLLGDGHGNFGQQRRFAAGDGAFSVAAEDVDGDGLLDLLVANLRSDDVSVLLGDGRGNFGPQQRYAAGFGPASLVTADADGDGRLDLFVGNANSNDVTVLLGDGDGSFTPSSEIRAIPPRQTPHLVDLDGDGVRDSVLLDDRGRVLFRRGLSGTNLYLPFVVVNPSRPARDVAVIRTPTGFALAASDVLGDSVSIYRLHNGAFVRAAALPAGRTPTRLAAADLDGDGLDDLVVASALTGSVHILQQRPDGAFAEGIDRPVGPTPVDVLFMDVDGRHGLDVVVTDRSSGDVSILLNDEQHSFADATRYRAGLSVSGLEQIQGRPQPRSLEQPVSTASGDFTGDGVPDLLVVAREVRQFHLLEGISGGGFRNPREPFRLAPPGVAVPRRAGQMRAADLDGDGDLDLAVVMEDQNEVWIYRNRHPGPALQAPGGFALLARVPAGNAPTGLTVAQLGDDNGDGLIDGRDNPDLLIGNGFGDVLSVLGNGNGTFRPFVRADQRVPFAVTDLDNDGDLDVILAEQARDRASALTRQPTAAGTPNAFQRSDGAFTPAAFERDADGGLIGPGDVAIADVDGINGADLIFANTGSNNVLVYLRQANGSFADGPLSFFAGTSPVALHPTQLNDDNGDGAIDDGDFLDLAVANQGSNDVSILIGSRNGALFALGPRLATNGLGPNAVTTRDVTGDRIPDVLATNGQDGTLATIPGIGNDLGLGSGFFDSTDLRLSPLLSGGPGPIADPIVQTQILSPTLGFALTQGGSLLRFDPTAGTSSVAFNPSPGETITTFFALAEVDLPAAAGFPVLFTGGTGTGSAGVVSMLTTSDGETFTRFLTGTGGLETPSALEVLERADGVFELYLTESGESQPVLLTLELRAELNPTERGDPFTPVVVLVTGLAVGASEQAGSGAASAPSAADAIQDGSGANTLPAGLFTATLALTEVFNPALAGLTDAPALEDAASNGEVVEAPGQEILAFVLDGGEGDSEPREPEQLPDQAEEDEDAPDLPAFIIGLKRGLDHLRRSDATEGDVVGTPDTAEPSALDGALPGQARPGEVASPEPPNPQPGTVLPPQEDVLTQDGDGEAPAAADALDEHPVGNERAEAPSGSESARLTFLLMAALRGLRSVDDRTVRDPKESERPARPAEAKVSRRRVGQFPR